MAYHHTGNKAHGAVRIGQKRFARRWIASQS